MHGRHFLFLILVFLCLAPALTSVAQDPANGPDGDGDDLSLTAEQRKWLNDHPVIRLGPYSNYAPAQFVDDQGNHLGIAADYVARIERLIGRSFESVYTDNWQEILDKARDREIDVIALAAETEDRLDYLRFTEPYLSLPAVIISRDNVNQRLTPDDLAGQRVAVVQGYAVHDYLKTEYPELILRPVNTTAEGLRDVSFGDADVFVSDIAVASHFISEEAITNLHVVGESGYVYHMGFAVRSDWPELIGILDAALAAIPESERDEIFNRWIHLSHEPEFASQRLLNGLLMAAVAVAIIAAFVIIWNRSLARQVARRTERLQDQLTERRRAERAFRQSEHRVRSIINSALDSVVTMDDHGRITGWSEQAERDFGWSREEAVNQDLADLIIPEPQREAHRAGLKRFLVTGEGPVLNTRIELTAIRKGGEEFPVELSIASIRRDDQHEFSAFLRDITERKSNEAELRAHRERLEELVDDRTAEMRAARDYAQKAEAELAERVNELEQALAEVKVLRGLLPICSYCKRIREGDEYQRSVEAYLTEHSDATFSHGVCPDCYEKHVKPDLDKLG